MTPPPAYGSSPTAPTFPSSALAGSGTPTLPQRYSRLAPDEKGNDIPLDAKWTRIKRTLVSPAVLEKAGVRYEARPEFVAVLGVLSREQIERFARESAEIRRARERSSDRRKGVDDDRDRDGNDRRMRDDGWRRNETYEQRDRKKKVDTSSSDDDVLWDESDTTEDEDDRRRRSHRHKGRRRDYSPDDKKREKDRDSSEAGSRYIPVPVIVSPPESTRGKNDEKLSPTSVGPKPILKNRNTNRVRFDKDGPREVPSESDFSRSPRVREDRHRHRDRDSRDHDRRDRSRDRERDRSRRDGDRDRERERDRDRDHDRDRDRDREHDHHHHHHHPQHHHRHHSRGDRDRDRDRDRERERGERPRDKDRDRDRDTDRDSKEYKREDKLAKKSALRETLGAVGIGGAAASLLSVLTEAAAGL